MYSVNEGMQNFSATVQDAKSGPPKGAWPAAALGGGHETPRLAGGKGLQKRRQGGIRAAQAQVLVDYSGGTRARCGRGEPLNCRRLLNTGFDLIFDMSGRGLGWWGKNPMREAECG